MKKFALVLVLLALALSARAQFTLGGHIGLSTFNDRLSLDIAPDFGYRLGSSVMVGSMLSYRTGYNNLGVTPYFHWRLIPDANLFNLFLSAQMPMVFAGDDFSLAAVLRPGVSMRVGSSVWLAAHVGSMGYRSTYYRGEQLDSYWFTDFTGDCLDIGFYIDF